MILNMRIFCITVFIHLMFVTSTIYSQHFNHLNSVSTNNTGMGASNITVSGTGTASSNGAGYSNSSATDTIYPNGTCEAIASSAASAAAYASASAIAAANAVSVASAAASAAAKAVATATATCTAEVNACTTATGATSTIMTDCYDWLHIAGSTSSGIYLINPGQGLQPFDVYCDMTTDGGGWTVIQSLAFWNNTWQQYKNGFNNSIENGNLWLGNDRINVMSQSNVTLRIQINGEQWPNTNPNIYLYGKYNFSISNEMNNYTLHISLPIEGNASNAYSNYGFYSNNGQPFSTVDKSSNQYGSSCASSGYGAWWFGDCTVVALNGNYNPSSKYQGFLWYSDATGPILPITSEMKIRRQ